MTEFSHQGLHCQYASCHQRDFLPFDCRHCSSHFCLAHRTRDQHECASLKAEEEAARRAPPPPPVSLPPKFKCHYPHCKIKELIPLACRNCAHNHCIKHRFPTQHACESFKGGVGRNTILPAGIMPPRPLDSNNSSKHSTAPIAAAPTRTVAISSSAAATSTPTPAPAVIAPAPIAVEIASPLAPPAAVWETAVSALNLSSSHGVSATAAAESATEAATARVRTPSPSSPLLQHTNTGSSCAAEMAQAASAASGVATASSSANSTSSTAASSTAAAAVAAAVAKRHNNTNVAHLSKLLKQHS